jgi:hypothetical protein
LANAAEGASAAALRETVAINAIVSLRNMVVLLELRVVCAGLKFNLTPCPSVAPFRNRVRGDRIRFEAFFLNVCSARAFSSEVDAGSREEIASNGNLKLRF